jgi:NADH:ubiquinone oxidoreductase subunit 3 (subunit A)
MTSQIDTLNNEFNILLTQYQDTYEKLINTIDSSNNELTLVPKSSFIGDSNLNTIQGTTADACLLSCSTTDSCSGATFDNNLSTCTLSSGNGYLINSSNQTAIVKQALNYTNELQQINNRLTEINVLMMENVKSNLNNYSQSQQQNNAKSEILNQNYNILIQERNQIKEMAKQYEALNSALENGNINVTSNYYSYILLLILVVFFIFIIIKFNITGQQRGGGMKISPLLFVFLALVIIFNAYIKK